MISTATPNFFRLRSFSLFSSSLSSLFSRLGRIATKAEYMADMGVLDASSADIYRYMNFDQIEDYKDVADTVSA